MRSLLPYLAGPNAATGVNVAVPDLAEVLAARQRIEPYLRPTPLYHYPALDATAVGVWVKHRTTSRWARSRSAAG